MKFVRRKRPSEIPQSGRAQRFSESGRRRRARDKDVLLHLGYTGCRISEALALTADRVDLKDGAVVIESLKKRCSGIYRPVPIPPVLVNALNMVHDIRAAQKRRDRGRSLHLWTFARNTAWRHVGAVMEAAKIKGPHATPKGLRHGFGVKAVVTGVPLNTLQQLLGHAQLSTTAIYMPTPWGRKTAAC